MQIHLKDLMLQLCDLLKNDKNIIYTSYGEAETYIVNDETFKKILLIEGAAKAIHDSINRKRKTKDHFYALGKLLNVEQSSYEYKFKMKTKYVLVTDTQKVLDACEGLYKAWINIRGNQVDKFISEKELYGDIEIEIKKDLTHEFQIKEELFEYMIQNKQFLGFARTSFSSSKDYPVCYYTLEDGTKKQEHLREDVPNILWYKDQDIIRSRSGSVAHLIAKDGVNAFSDVYVVENKKFPDHWENFKIKAAKVMAHNKKLELQKKEEIAKS